MNGKDREWEMGVLWDKDQTTAEFFLNKLTDTGFLVGDNEPDSGKAPEDFTIDYHAEPIGLAHVGVEIRQNLIDYGEGVERISNTLQEVISALTASTRKIDIEKRRSLR
jgi:predicted N-formylglutamate amidohydrolase